MIGKGKVKFTALFQISIMEDLSEGEAKELDKSLKEEQKKRKKSPSQKLDEETLNNRLSFLLEQTEIYSHFVTNSESKSS